MRKIVRSAKCASQRGLTGGVDYNIASRNGSGLRQNSKIGAIINLRIIYRNVVVLDVKSDCRIMDGDMVEFIPRASVSEPDGSPLAWNIREIRFQPVAVKNDFV